MRTLADAQAVLDVLRDSGYAAVIAGGAARDTHLGRTPKDYDIIVLGNPLMYDVLASLDYIHEAHIELFGDGCSMPGVAVNLEWVAKVTLHGTVIDVIKQVQYAATPEQAVEGFDCTLNMAWFSGDRVVLHDRFPHKGDAVELLPLCDNPKVRVAYLSNKFPEFIWPVIS